MDPDRLHRTLAELAARHQVPGAQLAVLHGGDRFLVHTGVADTTTGAPVAADTAFPVGSLTKPFGAALAMILVADGDVDLDDPLDGPLPEFGAGHLVTLRQLLSHTGGLPSDVPEGTAGTGDRARWVARHCRTEDLAHPPGTVFSYSNVGYVVVGRLVEAVTGMTWQEAVGAVLLEPLGIRPAFVAGPERTDRPVASGHGVQAARGRVLPVAEQDLPEVELPNGGLALSAGDLVSFARRYFAGCPDPAPLDRATADDMCFDQLASIAVGPYGMADGWGLGWARYDDGAADVYGHDGTGDGTHCSLRFDPSNGSAVALTANANTGARLWADLAPRLRELGLPVGDRPEPGAPAGPGPVSAAARCPGHYANGDTVFEVTRAADGGLLLGFGGAPRAELLCTPELRFTMRELGNGTCSPGRFVADPLTGRIDYLQITGRLAARTGDGSGPL
ncbi:serine hydrolase domain-containing protein [Streptomyces sp. NPDC020883]|uniref:serine hydrolase domain-containing protein n=1 Tax=Streptomyces sp. NPDC020883 TaxID=3365099 RepID=UPI0037A6F2F4